MSLSKLPRLLLRLVLAPFLDHQALTRLSKISKYYHRQINPPKDTKGKKHHNEFIERWFEAQQNINEDLKTWVRNQFDGTLRIEDLRGILVKNKFIGILNAMLNIDEQTFQAFPDELRDQVNFETSLVPEAKTLLSQQSFMTGSFLKPKESYLQNPIMNVILEMEIDFQNGGGISENVLRVDRDPESNEIDAIWLFTDLQNKAQEEAGFQYVEKCFRWKFKNSQLVEFSLQNFVHNFHQKEINDGFMAAFMVPKDLSSELYFTQCINHGLGQWFTNGKELSYRIESDGEIEIIPIIGIDMEKLGEFDYKSTNFLEKVNWSKEFPNYEFKQDRFKNMGQALKDYFKQQFTQKD